MEEIDEQLVTDIHRCPEKLFPQFLFGADTLKTVELLNRLILLSNGYEIVIDCLSCWQDVIGANYCLEPVAGELQQCNSDELLYQCLSLINQLLLFSPNAISKIRVQHELKGQ
uniref:TIMELESS domain-containing protein n=1 Tax=Syphacia muris TaxID=451379 RepID=A0A0N5AZX9_9BILA